MPQTQIGIDILGIIRKMIASKQELERSLLCTRQNEKERTLKILKRNLDEATLQISKAVLESTKFMKERDYYERYGREFKEKYENLLTELTKLEQFQKENNLIQTQYKIIDNVDQCKGHCDALKCAAIERENIELRHKL